jgi:hypothetical protein
LNLERFLVDLTVSSGGQALQGGADGRAAPACFSPVPDRREPRSTAMFKPRNVGAFAVSAAFLFVVGIVVGVI